MDFANWINTVGVSLILLAFILLTFKKISVTDSSYHLLNFFGSALAGYGAFIIDAMPFVVLESVWAVVALYGLVTNYSSSS